MTIEKTPNGWRRHFPYGDDPVETAEALADLYLDTLKSADPTLKVHSERDQYGLSARGVPTYGISVCVEGTASDTRLTDLQAWSHRATARIEQLEVQLAGCGVAAQGHAVGENDCVAGDYGWSASFADVKELRNKFEELWSAVMAIEGLAQGDIAMHPNRPPCPEILERIELARERIGRDGKIWRQTRQPKPGHNLYDFVHIGRRHRDGDEVLLVVKGSNGVRNVLWFPSKDDPELSNLCGPDKMDREEVVRIYNEFVGVHVAHCCVKHGCKYGDHDQCPVALELMSGDVDCESCRDDREDAES